MSGFVVKDGGGIRQVSLGRLLTIGRSQSNDLVLNSTYASRRHAWVWRQGDRFIIEDLGSTHGTFVNGQRLITPRFLYHDDVITMGDAQLFFVIKPELAAGRTPPGGVPQFMASQVFCANCGTANLPRAQQCERCGHRLSPGSAIVGGWPENHVRTSRPITPQEPVVPRPFPTVPPQKRTSRQSNAWILILLLAVLAVSLMIVVGLLVAYVVS